VSEEDRSKNSSPTFILVTAVPLPASQKTCRRRPPRLMTTTSSWTPTACSPPTAPGRKETSSCPKVSRTRIYYSSKYPTILPLRSGQGRNEEGEGAEMEGFLPGLARKIVGSFRGKSSTSPVS